MRPLAALSLAPVLLLGTFALTTLTARTAAADEPAAAPLVVIDPPLPDAPAAPARPVARYVEAAPEPGDVPNGHLPTPTYETRTESHWYGGQTLGVDAVALGMFVVGAASLGGSNSQTLATTMLWTSGITYLVGGPIVHAGHARYGMAVADLGVRAGAPVVLGGTGLLLGALAGSNQGGWGSLYGGLLGGVVGLGVGAITASVVDAASLANEPVHKRVETGMSWVPVAAPVKGGATAGLVGRF
jgi:hypothetical protein